MPSVISDSEGVDRQTVKATHETHLGQSICMPFGRRTRTNMHTPSPLALAVVVLIVAGAGLAAGDGTVLSAGDAADEKWAWSWSCENEACVKSELPVTPPELATPLRQCRLVCGAYGALWPRPTGKTTLGTTLEPFSPLRIRTTARGRCGNEMREALRIFREQLAQLAAAGIDADASAHDEEPNGTLNVTTHVASAETQLTWDTDESYTLNVTVVGDVINAKVMSRTWFGARHGLETLAQLTTPDGAGALLVVSRAQVLDAPVFAHRGLLLDTGRNFLPVADMERQVAAMAGCKLNVLHWHATDSHSFPLLTPRTPQLARLGAYSQKQTYSPEDIARLVAFARARGVRVLLEIDAPAHAGQGWQWGKAAGLGELALCVAQQPWRKSCIQPPCGQLDPTNVNVDKVLRDVYADLLPLFPGGEFVHLGGDEVFVPCWNSTPHVVERMSEQGLNNDLPGFLRLWANFHARVLESIDSLTPQGIEPVPAVIWSSHLTDPDVIDLYLNKSRHVVQTWVPANDSLSQRLLELGWRVIVSTKDAWYLDRGWWGTTRYASWKVAYDNPVPERALGGEAAMWGELVDAAAVNNKVWPRTAAVAERLWTNPKQGSSHAEARFFAQRDLLLLRGVAAETVAPGWCVQNQGDCA